MGKIILLCLFCLVLVFPLWLMVTNSFTNGAALVSKAPRLFPKDLILSNYQKAFSLPLLPQWLLNSGVVVVGVVVAGVVVNGSAGYVFAFHKSRWATYAFWIMLAPIFVTRFVIIISQFIVVGKLGMKGMVAVIGMSIFWPTGIYLFKNYFQSIPNDLLESARIDGAHEWTIFRRVVMPLSKPILGASIVFLGMAALGDYIWQMLVLQSPASRTFLVGLLQSTLDVYVVKNFGYDLAVGTLLFIPYVLLFAFSSKYFISGLTLGSVRE